jgi:hypothetical protein
MKPSTAILTAACAAAAFVLQTTTPATAQLSDAATAVATVTVESTPITVSGGGFLSFGTHFAAAGIVENQGEVEWFIDGPVGATVELSLTQLPVFLEDGAGNLLPVSYGSTSLSVWCDDGAGNVTGVTTRPEFGGECLLGQSGQGLVELGIGLGEPTGRVTVDLTGAPDGTYTGTLELTAIIR